MLPAANFFLPTRARIFVEKLLVNTHSSKVLFINASSISVKSFNLFSPPTGCSFSFIAREKKRSVFIIPEPTRCAVTNCLKLIFSFSLFCYFSVEFSFVVKGVSVRWGNFNDGKLVGDLLFDDAFGCLDRLAARNVYAYNYNGSDPTKFGSLFDWRLAKSASTSLKSSSDHYRSLLTAKQELIVSSNQSKN